MHKNGNAFASNGLKSEDLRVWQKNPSDTTEARRKLADELVVAVNLYTPYSYQVPAYEHRLHALAGEVLNLLEK